MMWNGRSLGILLALVAVANAAYGHTYLGVEYGTLTRARVQSPNGTTTDYPDVITGTELSTVCFKITNTGSFDSRITAIGFELPEEPTGFTLVSPTTGDFKLVQQVSNVPGLPDVTLDFALLTGPTFGGGRPQLGLPPSSSPTTFCVTGPFDRDVSIERLLDNGVVRFQQAGADGELGDVSVWEGRQAPGTAD